MVSGVGKNLAQVVEDIFAGERRKKNQRVRDLQCRNTKSKFVFFWGVLKLYYDPIDIIKSRVASSDGHFTS